MTDTKTEAVTESERIVRKQSSPNPSLIYKIARELGNKLYWHFRDLYESCTEEEYEQRALHDWMVYSTTCALFGIKMRRGRAEVCRDKKTRFPFFVTHESDFKPSSFRLIQSYAAQFGKMPHKYLAMLNQPFSENKSLLGIDAPYDDFMNETQFNEALELAKQLVDSDK